MTLNVDIVPILNAHQVVCGSLSGLLDTQVIPKYTHINNEKALVWNIKSGKK